MSQLRLKTNLLTVSSYKVENKLHTFNKERINVTLLKEKDWSIERNDRTKARPKKKKNPAEKKIPNPTVPCLAFGTHEEIVQ